MVYLYFVAYRKCSKPLKPKVTIQIASDTSQSKDAVQPIPILGALKQGSDILIAHGSPIFLSFETIVSMSLTLMMTVLIYFKYVTMGRIHFEVKQFIFCSVALMGYLLESKMTREVKLTFYYSTRPHSTAICTTCLLTFSWQLATLNQRIHNSITTEMNNEQLT